MGHTWGEQILLPWIQCNLCKVSVWTLLTQRRADFRGPLAKSDAEAAISIGFTVTTEMDSLLAHFLEREGKKKLGRIPQG